jgi:hypothetical protein
MMLFATISWTGMAVLLLGGLLAMKIFKSGARSAPGFILKTLGVVAVVAGIGVLVSRGHRSLDDDSIVNVELGEEFHGIDFPEGFESGDFLNGAPFEHDRLGEHGRVRVFPSSLSIVLGSGLIILGAMLFGRERTRPFALKAITFLGVGAIIFSVVSFFGEPPRAEPTSSRRLVHLERHHERAVHEEQRIARRPTRSTRAKRPSLRPDRPTSETEKIEDFLPTRAGEIPVSVELAKAETKSAEDVKVAEPKVPEPTVVAEPKVEEPQIETPSAVAAETATDNTDAAPTAEAQQPAPEADKPAAENPPTTVAEEAKPAEEAPPAEPAAASEPAETNSESVEPSAPPAEPAAEKPVEVAAAKPAVSDNPSPPEPAPAAEPAPPATVPSVPTIISSEPRPAWVDRAPGLSDGVYAMVVSSGPYVSVPECQRALNDEILAATNHYIDEYLGDEHAASLVNLPTGYLRQFIKKVEYAEVVESPSVGRMHQLHARLEFDDRARSDFQRLWRNAVVQDRLWYTGGGAALVLALLATFYGYLKLDLKTGAPHKGRLQLAATLVALIVAAGALLARWAVPF